MNQLGVVVRISRLKSQWSSRKRGCAKCSCGLGACASDLGPPNKRLVRARCALKPVSPVHGT
eukprot:772753-Alexandrium_andersonii.AAC.1